MKKIIIAIDGYSSCGKSTMAKQLAATLQYTFVDSGAMYRAITLYFLEHKIPFQDEDALRACLEKIKLHFEPNAVTGSSEICLNGKNVHLRVREMDVASMVSEVAALHLVRAFAVAQQQALGEHKALVMDGRDIGTTVFPNAELKIFVTADIEVRVQRRLEELRLSNPNISADEVRHNLEARDYLDTTRKESPLRKAEDAILLDNSNLTREAQLQMALQWAHERMA